ncbi:MAG: hypothetical protein JW910_09270 [Anaerolineae bacterium]|nr:hypothetical protein [Anaerolineae bacterium]
MPYTLEWLIPDRVLVGRFTGQIPLEELAQFTAEQHAAIAQGTPPVHFINDARQAEGMKIDFKGLQGLVKALGHAEGLGWHIDVMSGRFQRMLSAFALQLYGTRSRQFDTMEEALAFLRDNDSTLPRE